MDIKKLKTNEKITWCPGCLNNSILLAVRQALSRLVERKKIRQKNIVAVTGIGCHAKIYDYLNTNAFYSIHGRVLPTALGIKTANPDLTVLGFGGDGDTYAEGISHFVQAGRYNADITMIVYNNQVFALTVGQATPTTEKDFVDGSTPFGVKEMPLNPLAIALISGAGFVARGYALNVSHLTQLIERAILHKGFSFIDVLQPCLKFHNTIPYLKKNIYQLDDDYNFSDFQAALKKAMEWNYCYKDNTKIPIGIFYQREGPTFNENLQIKNPLYKTKRNISLKEILEEFK